MIIFYIYIIEEIQAALSPNTPAANDFSFTQVLRRGVRNLDSKSPTDQLAPLENVSKDGKYAEKAAKMSNGPKKPDRNNIQRRRTFSKRKKSRIGEKQTRHNKFTHRSAVPSFSYEPINELREEMPITYPNAMTVNPLYAISPPLNMGATPNLKGLQDTPKRSLNLNIDQKILEILKRVNLGLVTISDLSLQISASMKEVIVRVSGKVAPNGIGGWFNFEIIRKDIFAVAFTTEQAAIEDFVQKMFNTKLGVFEKLEKTSVSTYSIIKLISRSLANYAIRLARSSAIHHDSHSLFPSWRESGKRFPSKLTFFGLILKSKEVLKSVVKEKTLLG